MDNIYEALPYVILRLLIDPPPICNGDDLSKIGDWSIEMFDKYKDDPVFMGYLSLLRDYLNENNKKDGAVSENCKTDINDIL